MNCLRVLLAVMSANFSLQSGSFAQDLPVTSRASDKPAIFAEGLVSDGSNNRDFAISPDGTEIFYTIQQKDFAISSTVRLHRQKGAWSKPEIASFSGRFNDLEASFSPDGKRIYFSSNRPVDISDSTQDFDIWFVNRIPGGWSEPVHAGFVVNGSTNEFYPSVTRNGNLYFTSEFKQGKGKEDIVMCAWQGGAWSAPVSLPESINSKGFEFNAFVDPDEQFIIYTAYGRADDLGRGDLYISRKDGNGNWLPARHMGNSINSKFLDYCPYVSPDKKLFFFSSNRPVNKTPFVQRKDYRTISAMLLGAGNGMDDIYWMTADQLLSY